MMKIIRSQTEMNTFPIHFSNLKGLDFSRKFHVEYVSIGRCKFPIVSLIVDFEHEQFSAICKESNSSRKQV